MPYANEINYTQLKLIVQ